ncbi:MAG: hypothetical protein EOM19_03050 [Candidatus Moranbacteria bacterium]|nr:hypothetical protein [Candidatus Moranbacteria bacterium]
MYTVKTEFFEGPLDVLLGIIEARELDITLVSLSEVTDQFVCYVESSDTIPLEHLADFLVVASRLLLIKSRALLPILENGEEEEDLSIDLEAQIKGYKRFKEISDVLGRQYALSQTLFRREVYLTIPLPEPSSFAYSFSSKDMNFLFSRLVEQMPDPEALKKKVIRRIISLEEKILYFKRIFSETEKGTFFSLLGKDADNDSLSVSFLAFLELARTKVIRVHQEEHFGEIIFEKIKKEV